MSVEAFINGVSCARSTVRQVDNQFVYVLKVRAAGSGSGNCGAAGRNVEFRINDENIGAVIGWFVDGAVRYDLGAPTPGPRLLIPRVRQP
jgi:carbon monoxide dehydrogenase subunit G